VVPNRLKTPAARSTISHSSSLSEKSDHKDTKAFESPAVHKDISFNLMVRLVSWCLCGRFVVPDRTSKLTLEIRRSDWPRG
jgi:hypothetical protein